MPCVAPGMPVVIEVDLSFDTKAKHDIDNYGKLLLDALAGIVWLDDSQIVKMSVTKGYDKANPRIEIGIAPIA
jgi:Holliday junction resolvase RusA-like endonuclease